MNEKQWQHFCNFKTEFRKQIESWQKIIDDSPKKEFLRTLIIQAAQKDKVPAYSLENLIIYNTALDEVQKSDRIAAIAVGDNPGKDEQLNKNRKYLVGQAGKVAASFFARNPPLQIDFRKNVIILNKTPFHSAKTKELAVITKALAADNCEESLKIARLIEESQVFMAEITANLHKNLCSAATTSEEHCDLWLVGYGELKKGFFDSYKTSLQNCYAEKSSAAFCPAWQKVYVFQHFSMNCFANDLNKYSSLHPQNNLKESLYQLGSLHKAEIFE